MQELSPDTTAHLIQTYQTEVVYVDIVCCIICFIAVGTTETDGDKG